MAAEDGTLIIGVDTSQAQRDIKALVKQANIFDEVVSNAGQDFAKTLSESVRTINKINNVASKIRSPFELAAAQRANALAAQQLEIAKERLQIRQAEARLVERAGRAQKSLPGTAAGSQLRLPARTSGLPVQVRQDQQQAALQERATRDLAQAQKRRADAENKLAAAAEGQVSDIVRTRAEQNRGLLALPAKTGGVPVQQRQQQLEAVRAEEGARQARVDAEQQATRAAQRRAEALEKLARAAEGEVSQVVRSTGPQNQKLLPGTTGGPGGQGIGGSRSLQGRLQREVDRQIGLYGKVNAELQQTVNSYNRQQISSDRLVKTQDRLSTQLVKETKTKSTASKGTQGNRRVGNVLAGVGFSALFGGGPGEILGGGIGGLGGLGGSLIGSVLGRSIDDLGAAATELGTALQKPIENVKALTQANLLASREQEKLVNLLVEFGYSAKANKIVLQQLSNTLGAQGVSDLERLAQASDELNRAVAQAGAQLQAAIAGPLADFLTFIAKLVNAVVTADANNARLSALQERLGNKETDELLGKFRELRGKQLLGRANESEITALLDAFERRFPVPLKDISPKQKAEDAITRSNNRLSRIQKELSGDRIIEQYARAERERQRQQEGYDRQRADILRSYEESLANLRESVERRITQMRLSAIAKENQILDQRAANELKALELRNSITQRLQREAAAQVGTDPRVAQDAQALSQAFASFEQQSLGIEQQKAKLKRDTALEVLKLEIDAEVFKANIAKQVAKLNLNTARQIENINRGIREKNEDVNIRIFELQKVANAERLVSIAAEFRLLQVQLQFLGATQDYLDNLQKNILFFESEAKRIRALEPPKPFQEVAAVGGGGVDTSGVDAALQNRVTLERELLRLKLEGLDITKAEGREAILNASSTIRVDAENTINGLLREQNEGLARQQRIQELVKSGLDEQQATAVQRIEQERDIALARLDGLEAALRTKLADTDDLAIQKEIRKELEQIATLRGRVVKKSEEATTKAKELNKQEELMKSAVQRVAQGIEDGIVSAIDAAVDGTKSLGEALQEVASTLLKDIGRMLIRAGISGLGTQAGLPGFPGNYSGGPIASGSPSIVGERGPELFVPNVSGRVVNNEQFDAARQAMTTSSAVQSSTAALDREQEQIEMMNNPSPLDVRFETYSIGGMDVVTREEAMKISEQSAKKARAQVFADMRNKPATRAQLGIG